MGQNPLLTHSWCLTLYGRFVAAKRPSTGRLCTCREVALGGSIDWFGRLHVCIQWRYCVDIPCQSRHVSQLTEPIITPEYSCV